MKTKRPTPNEIIYALERIGKYGKSEISLDIYLSTIAILPEMEEKVNHNLAVAELMSRLAPKGKRDTWYLAGLLHNITRVKSAHSGENANIILALLRKAKISKEVISCIQNYDWLKDAERWTPMMAALNFSDAHVSSKGDIYTTDECCRKNGGGSRCQDCMYARYYFSRYGLSAAAEDAIEELREDILEAEERKKGGLDGKLEGRMGKDRKKAAPEGAGKDYTPLLGYECI